MQSQRACSPSIDWWQLSVPRPNCAMPPPCRAITHLFHVLGPGAVVRLVCMEMVGDEVCDLLAPRTSPRPSKPAPVGMGSTEKDSKPATPPNGPATAVEANSVHQALSILRVSVHVIAADCMHSNWHAGGERCNVAGCLLANMRLCIAANYSPLHLAPPACSQQSCGGWLRSWRAAMAPASAMRFSSSHGALRPAQSMQAQAGARSHPPLPAQGGLTASG